jgi:hypothetical protein
MLLMVKCFAVLRDGHGRTLWNRSAVAEFKPIVGAKSKVSDKIFLLAPFPQLARAVSSRGALKGELLVRVRNMGRISSRSTSF